MAGKGELLLALDQGTTSTRAMLFAADGAVVAGHSLPLRQSYPADGWVEHDPGEIAAAAIACVARVSEGVAESRILGLGITNQRETTVLWDRRTGRPLAPAIVWQDRRTAARCAALREAGHEALVRARTGLLLDPYFSGTKLAWLLDAVPGARAAAKAGDLAFGTIDSWLIWTLTGGRVHATDATNASRTLLFDIERQAWSPELLDMFDIPAPVLPEVRDCAADYGATDRDVTGVALPIRGVAGDQQAAAFGQACFAPGLTKSTYGTGCFALVNAGAKPVASANTLIGTVAYRLRGTPTFALEGSIFVAGAALQWLRDGLRLLGDAAESAALAAKADPRSGVVMVPAFTGLGAPYWDPQARGAILGLTRDSGAAEIARAALESVSFQTRDLMEAMGADLATVGLAAPHALRVDGGMVANDWFCQNLADILGRPVERPAVTETTALGAAYLAGLQAGLYPDLASLAVQWRRERLFEPRMSDDERDGRYAAWSAAVRRVLSRRPPV